MKKITGLNIQFFILILSFFTLAASFYLQYAKGFDPCPLCLMQRICVIGIFIIGLIALFATRRKPLTIIQAIFVLLGIFFASRQLWLLSLPGDQVPACLPGLDVLMHYFPWQDTARALLWGSGDCTEIRWTALGLSLPAWSLLYFVIIGIACGFNWQEQKSRKRS